MSAPGACGHGKSGGALGLLLGLALSAGAAALPDDSEQPIRIVTNEAIRDETTGETLYRGDVTMVQGTLEINADTVRLEERRGTRDRDDSLDPLAGSDVFRITARGAPARMRQQPEAGAEWVHADARVIEYFQPRSLVRLREAVTLRQGSMSLQAAQVDYQIDQQRIVAYAAPGSGQRVRTVMPAERVTPAD